MWVRDPEPPGKARRRVKRAQRKEAAAARAAATRRPSDPVVGSPKWVTVDSEAPLPKPSEPSPRYRWHLSGILSQMATISLLTGKRSKGRGAQRRRSDKPRMQLLLEAEGAEEEEEEGGLPMIARFPLPAHGKLQSKDAVGVSGTIIAGKLGCIRRKNTLPLRIGAADLGTFSGVAQGAGASHADRAR